MRRREGLECPWFFVKRRGECGGQRGDHAVDGVGVPVVTTDTAVPLMLLLYDRYVLLTPHFNLSIRRARDYGERRRAGLTFRLDWIVLSYQQ